MQNVVKNLIIEMDRIADGKNNADNIEKNIEEEDSKNLDLFMADSYSHAVVIIHMH